MADDTANASVDVDVSGTLKVGGGSIGDDGIVQSNGQTLVGALCAADAKQTGNQFVSDGKVIACRMTHASPAP